MDISDACFDRLNALIEEIGSYMQQLPDGPERQKMECLLQDMKRMVQQRMDDRTGSG